MFRIDLTTLETTPLIERVPPTCEDVDRLRVIGSALFCMLDLVANAKNDDPALRRYLFRDLLNAQEIRLGQPWFARDLHCLQPPRLPGRPTDGGGLLRVDELCGC